jgi:hypothetical protein
MNLYFLSLLEDKKREGHKKPLNKFIQSKEKDDITFCLGKNQEITIMVERLSKSKKVIWSLSFPGFGSVCLASKSKINFYLLEPRLEFKKSNLFLRLTDHILQNPI